MSRQADIEAIALRLFYEKGYKAATMRIIAKEAGCEVANLYNYLSSKQALLEQQLFLASAAFHEGVDEIMDSGYHPEEKLKALIALYVRVSADRPYRAALLVHAWKHLPPDSQKRFLKERHEYEQKVKTLIVLAIERGILQNYDPAIMTQTFLASVRWLFNWFVNPAVKVNAIELQRQVSALILEGMKRV